MNNKKSTYAVLTLVLPQILMFLVAIISIYIASKGHGDLNFLYSFFFIIFYGSLFLPSFLLITISYCFKLLAVKNSVLSILLFVSVAISTILIPVAFLILSLQILKNLHTGLINKRQFFIIAGIHFFITLILIIVVQFSSILEVYSHSFNLQWQIAKIAIALSLSFLVWGSLFRLAK